jgi:hypothetical protein
VVPWRRKRDGGRSLTRLPPLGPPTNGHAALLSPHTGSPEFRHLSSAARSVLLADVSASVSASHGGVEEGTHEKQHLAWTRWTRWLQQVELFDDEYLEAFQPKSRTRLIGAFAAAVRAARFSGAAYDQLAASTVSGTVNDVASAFVDAGVPDPRQTESGATSRFLQRQYRSYRNSDANIKQQKALTASILLDLHEHSQLPISSQAEKATATLAIGAFFFAMRSCEYTHVTGPRRTKPLRLRNLRFIKNRRTMDLTSPDIASADAIAITFEFQKTDIQNETVHQHSTGRAVLCPVSAWADIVQRILAYPNSDEHSLVSTVVCNDKRSLITGAFLCTKLRDAAQRIGEDVLGFPPSDIGTHSIRSGGAMAMYLAGVPVFTIMLIGRWSSDAFLRYIRRQVLQFSAGVSKRMVATLDDFFTLPDFDTENPRTRGHRHNYSSPLQQKGLARNPTPDHVLESLTPRFELAT